jgi:hypothetical protein
MPRILVWLGLLAALSGPLLRQAEGAEDLVRSLAELGCPPLVEETDGGVGDDAGAAVLRGAHGLRFQPHCCGEVAHYPQADEVVSPPESRPADPSPVLRWHSWIAARGSARLRLSELKRLLL